MDSAWSKVSSFVRKADPEAKFFLDHVKPRVATSTLICSLHAAINTNQCRVHENIPISHLLKICPPPPPRLRVMITVLHRDVKHRGEGRDDHCLTPDV